MCRRCRRPSFSMEPSGATLLSSAATLLPPRFARMIYITDLVEHAGHDQRFDRAAPLTEISVNFKIEMQRMRRDFCQSGLGVAYGTRISWPARRWSVTGIHALTFRSKTGLKRALSEERSPS
jgi:hypothetical protein